ncbi:hypothetical protein [Streptomyces yangpuensis]|uniref:hypothetical protein n=1 Tax=Streptomyces yangpuensis TaxID=1648182 RepID=UPI0036562EAE
MSRRKPRSSGISLGNRATGYGMYDDEMNADGGKRYLRRRVRGRGKTTLRRLVLDATGTAR